MSYPAGTSTHPINGGTNWTIANNYAGQVMDSIVFDGISGGIAFDRCMTGANTFNDNNPTFFGFPLCLTEGTPGSNIGFSVGSGTGGTAGIDGTVQYQNVLHLAASSPVGDLWGQITIAFSGSAFTSGSTFTFRADTDEVSNIVANPEPGTWGLMGASLVAIGLKLRRRSVRW